MNRALKRIDITETPRLFERRVVLGMLTSPVVTLAAGVRAEPKPTMKVSKKILTARVAPRGSSTCEPMVLR